MTADYEEHLNKTLIDVIGPNASVVDEKGTFPRAGVEALQEGGIFGLTVAEEFGGLGLGMHEAADVVERIASSCASTAMITLMHFAATAVLGAVGAKDAQLEIAAGAHVSTLAFSEVGSRSHFWAPLGTATPDGENYRLDAKKSWITAGREADSYVWSSRPVASDGPMTLWLVASASPGLSHPAPFDGLGLRGNGSIPVTAESVRVPRNAMLGDDGAGLDIALASALPWFLVMSGAFCLGLMESSVAETLKHVTSTRLEHLDAAIINQVVPRADLARMRIATDSVRTLLNDTISTLETNREDAMLRVLEVKAAAGEAAIDVTDLAMKVCGGAAFRKELEIERNFRDTRAARVMAPTTDALLDFIGRAIGGLPLLES